MATNIFEILKLETKENYHSMFITAIINNNEYARISFLKMLEGATERNFNKERNFNIPDYLKLKVVTEKTLSLSKEKDAEIKEDSKKSRVDIFFSDKHGEHDGKTRIIIENKIYAGDQKQQLSRYNEYLKKKDYNGALFYLTLDGKDASNYSKIIDFNTKERKSIQDFKDYYRISYSKHIINWLNDVLISEDLDCCFRLYIQDYLAIVRKLTKEMSKLNDLFEKESNFSKENVWYLEYRFWEFIVNKIFEEKSNSINGLSNKQKYNINKIKGKEKNPRDYGIIIERINNNGIFIGVNIKDKQLFIYEVVLDNNEWKKEENIFLDNIKINDIKNKSDIEMITNKIIGLIK